MWRHCIAILNLLIIILITMSCAVDMYQPPGLVYYVAVDPAFGSADGEVVRSALRNWTTATGVRFNVVDAACQEDGIQPGYVICIRPITPLNAAASMGWKSAWIGLTRRYPNQSSDVWLETYKGYQRTLHEVAMHEIGHALGLEHTEKGTVMCFNTGCSVDKITPQDVSQYWALRGFEYNASPPYCLTEDGVCGSSPTADESDVLH